MEAKFELGSKSVWTIPVAPILTAVFGLMAVESMVAPELQAQGLSEVDNQARVRHAKELLGSAYAKSVVRKAESYRRLDLYIYQQVLKELPKNKKYLVGRVAQTLIDESARWGFDPMFTMAVIRHESRFRPDVVGPFGEIGLMQLKPGTAQWLCEKLKMSWRGPSSLKDVNFNIKLGTAYLALLRERFPSEGAHYLAAFNMGAVALKRALVENKSPKTYAHGVMRHYLSFYRELHAATQRMAQLAGQ